MWGNTYYLADSSGCTDLDGVEYPHDTDKLFKLGSYWYAADNWESMFCAMPGSDVNSRANIAIEFSRLLNITGIVILGNGNGPLRVSLGLSRFEEPLSVSDPEFVWALDSVDSYNEIEGPWPITNIIVWRDLLAGVSEPLSIARFVALGEICLKLLTGTSSSSD